MISYGKKKPVNLVRTPLALTSGTTLGRPVYHSTCLCSGGE